MPRLSRGEDPGVYEDLEVARDGRLSQARPKPIGEFTDAGLTALVRGDHGDQLKPGRIGQRLELVSEVRGLAGGDGLTQQRRAARIR